MCFPLFDDFSVQGDLNVLEVKSNSQAPCEATNKEAFFSRVESYSISFFPSFWISMSHLSSCFYVMLLLLHVLAVCKLKFPLAPHCLKWAGKPRILSPLMCARYGWISVGCDMLKCCSCQAFLCASLQPTLDFEKCEWNLKQLHNNNTRGQTGCFLVFLARLGWYCRAAKKFFFKLKHISSFKQMKAALQRYQGSFRHSMKSFVLGLTFHVQVGASILHKTYISAKVICLE